MALRNLPEADTGTPRHLIAIGAKDFPATSPGDANLPIGVLLMGVLQTANREIGVPGIYTNIICSISDSRYEKPVALGPRIHYAPDL